jgi:hypothetical protein
VYGVTAGMYGVMGETQRFARGQTSKEKVRVRNSEFRCYGLFLHSDLLLLHSKKQPSAQVFLNADG